MKLWYSESIRKSLTILGILAVLVQANTVGFYVFLYQANVKSLSETVCERRVPHCHARCFLQKQLTKADDQSSSGSEKHSFPESQTSSEYLPTSEEAPIIRASSFTFYHHLSSDLLSGVQLAIFNPPKYAEAV